MIHRPARPISYHSELARDGCQVRFVRAPKSNALDCRSESRSNFERVRLACRGGNLLLLFLLPLAILFLAFPKTLRAQEKPIATIDLDCRAWAISSQGLAACVQFHQMHFQKYDIERDNIWTVTLKRRRREIVDGVKLVQVATPFSFAMRALAFSPDGKLLTVQMTTSQVTDEQGNIQENKMVDLMDTDGKEIPVEGTKTSVILDATNATWLADDETVAYLLPSEDSDLLFQIGLTHPKQGKGGVIFNGHLFTAVAWDAARSSAVAIERDKLFEGPIKLVRLDLIHETDTTLATLQNYLGQLALSPSGNQVAYFTDGETIEVRSLDNPQKPVTVHAAYGTLAWGNYSDRILLKRGSEKQTGDLVWLSIPDGNLTPILHDLFFSNFVFSPEAHAIVVVQPGDNHLSVFPLH